ncbi:cytochrome P450 [Pseudofulvibacter geojedonensis]|uniref:Cytochrome P450 n=1 Tax=Pseudofulvibacter geojedonensis TaxID=1123758 RepID=A0ABW3I033_9FLAO
MSEILKIKDLPSPKGQFILGHLNDFKADNKHQVLEDWVKECGELFKIHFVGKEFIVSANHDMNNQILKLRPEKFRRFYKLNEIMEEMGIVGVFNTEGEDWKRHRKPSSEALNLRKVNGFYPIIANKTEILLEKWKSLALKNQCINVQQELMKYTVDITTTIAFGYNLDTINDKSDSLQQHLERIFPMINERITAPIPIWRFYKRNKDKELESSLKTIEALVLEFIQKAKDRLTTNPALRENPSNFLEALLVEKENASHFSDKEIYGNVFTILLAGEDTTSNSISWVLYYLAQHPEMVNKIREEAIATFDNNSIPQNHQDLKKLKYTNAVIQETLRLKPVTPNLYMQANEELIINNFLIPKDTTIMLQNKVAHTQEKHFYKPNTFLPERWLASNKCPISANHSPEVIKTFGAGSRFCPGKNLAMHEMLTAISSICKEFDFTLGVHKNDVTEKFSFTMFPENLLIKFSSISSK